MPMNTQQVEYVRAALRDVAGDIEPDLLHRMAETATDAAMSWVIHQAQHGQTEFTTRGGRDDDD